LTSKTRPRARVERGAKLNLWPIGSNASARREMDGRRGADATELEGRGGGVARARHDTELHLIHARRHRALRPIQRQGGRGREEGGAPADGREEGRRAPHRRVGRG
jgi:hypothetical protein